MQRHPVLDMIPRARRNVIAGAALAVAATAQAVAAGPNFSTLYEFPGSAHGVNPEAGVILGPNGSLYGTTDSDDINAGGIVFQLSPPLTTGRAWTQKILKRFLEPRQGGYPLGLFATSSGVLYGLTLDGGGTPSGSGIVFSLTPPATGQTQWTTATLHRFRGGSDGDLPSGSVIVDDNGVVSGTTILGGAGPGLDGYGVAFSLTPSETQPGVWTETILHRFTSSPDGATPGGALLPSGASVRFGVTTTGGTGICSDVGCGTVYQLRQNDDHWLRTIIYQFQGGADGSVPVDRLIADAGGSLYGVTANGGLPGPNGQYFTGTVFRLDPPPTGASRWTKTILYEFQGNDDGYLPEGSLAFDANGALYGTTELGGASYGGTVFKLTANAPGQPWTKTILHNFRGGAGDGANPTGPVTLDANGTLFGTTLHGGSTNDGTVYRITR